MAVSIPSVGTTAETATSVATPTTLSPGLPATRAVGDILLCLTVCRATAPTVSVATAGWVEIFNSAATGYRIALYACKVTGSEAAAQPVWAGLTTGTSGTGASAQIACVRGLAFTRSLATLAHVVGSALFQGSSSVTQAMGGAITPTKPNEAIFSCAARGDNDFTDANWPLIASGENLTWAKVAAVLNSASGADHAQSWQWAQQGAATAISNKTVSVTGASLDTSEAVLVALLTAQTLTLTAATETDSAQALSFVKPIHKTLTVATETGTARALVVTKPIRKTLTPATETDVAQPLDYELVAGGQNITITPATETDAAQALVYGYAATYRVFDGADDYITLGPGGADSGWGTYLAVLKLDLDLETKFLQGIQAAGADSPIFGRNLAASGGWLYWNDGANTRRASAISTPLNESWHLVAVTKAGGTATARFHKRRLDTGAVSHNSSDTGTSVDKTAPNGWRIGARYDGANFVSDFDGPIFCAARWDASALSDAALGAIDSLQDIINLQPTNLWILNQASPATPVVDYQAASADEVSHNGTTSETGLIPNFDPRALTQRTTLTAATESDSARALVVTKPIHKTLTAALEADSARALTVTKPIHKTLTAAVETDAAQALTASKPIHKTLAVATETDAAAALTALKRLTLIAAAETNTAQPVSFSQAGAHTIIPAVETDTAVALSRQKRLGLSSAAELDTAAALTALKRKTLSSALEADLAGALAAKKRVTLGAALEGDVAQILSVSGAGPQTVTLIAATEHDQAIALVHVGGLTIVLPTEPSGTIARMEQGRIDFTRRGRIDRTKAGTLA